MKMCNCKHALGYEEETGCAVCGHDGCEYNDTIEQLTARVKELEAEAKHWKQHSYTQESTIATLEQQLSDEKGVCESLRSQNSDAVKEVQKLEKQIQQAERRGYELCVCACSGNPYIDDDAIPSFEQACAERKEA